MGRDSLIDQQTFEILDEIRGIIAGADESDKKLDSHDISYMHGLLKAVIMHNSLPAAKDPEAGKPSMHFVDRAKQVGRSMLP